MWSSIEYLKEASLVADIQKKFGIRDKDCAEDDKGKVGNANGFAKSGGGGGGGDAADYVIGNKFWYYLFAFGTDLGDEIFYASFIPFWFWNIDGAVGRRVVSVWALVMYIGQGFKDVIKWPRPSHPAKRLQKKWAEEYGMPSTHAMVAISIPFSVLFYTMNRYIYSLPLGIAFCILWCSVICVSRIYFGMHTVFDIIVGLCLAILLMLPLLPLIDNLDYFWLTNSWSPAMLIILGILMIMYFPHTDKWTPTRGDTTVIIGVCIGIQIGGWHNYQLGNMTPYPHPPPYTIIWPDSYMLGKMLSGVGALRTILGFTLLYGARSLTKSVTASLLHRSLSVERIDVRTVADANVRKGLIFIELATKFVTYFVMGFNTVYTVPYIFRYFGIERPTFYTEM